MRIAARFLRRPTALKSSVRTMVSWETHVNACPPRCLEYVKAHAEEGNPKSVVDAIDAFASTTYMINIGSTKGGMIDGFIRDKKPTVMAELGAYSGYSTVRFASLQREVSGPGSHYYSFEYSPVFADIVKEMVAFAGLSDQVTVLTGAFAEQYHELQNKKVDIYFIDHENSCYLPDAKLILEKSETLRPGSLLVADNILMPGAPKYLKFMEVNDRFTSTRKNVTIEEKDGTSWEDMVLVSEFLG